MKKLITLFCLFLFLPVLFASYSGRVYFDKNASGTFDTGDIPLEHIVVTDGQNCVKTNVQGQFTLPGYSKTRFISVTTPAGYKAEKHYISTSQGSSSYDFPLQEHELSARTNHKFVQITDTEILSSKELEYTNKWVPYLKNFIKTEEAAFLVHTGDICYSYGLNNHIKVVNQNTMDCPVYYCIGNHDLVSGTYGEKLFESIYGPCWYSFDAGNFHYVVTPMLKGDYAPSYTQNEVSNWLKNDLAFMDKSKSLIVLSHDNLTYGNDFSYGTQSPVNLRQYNLKAWIYGHIHNNYVRDQNGVKAVCTATLDKGGIDHSASAYRLFELNQTDIVDMGLHYCYTDPQVAIAYPLEDEDISLTPTGTIPLSVNAYYSGARVKEIAYEYSVKNSSVQNVTGKLEDKTDWNWYSEFSIPGIKRGDILDITVKVLFKDGKEVEVLRSAKIGICQQLNIKTNNPWTNLLSDSGHSGNHSGELTLPLTPVWVSNVGTNIFMSSPLVDGDQAYIASCDDGNNNKAGITALDVRTGKINWQFKTRNSIKNSIACDGNKVFAQDAEGNLYAVNTTTGSLIWEVKLEIGNAPYMAEGLIASDGIVYAGTGRGLGAYSATDGKAIWKNTAWNKNEAATTTLTLGGNVITAGAQWAGLYGHNATTGAQLWKLSADGLNNRGASTLYHDNRFYVISTKHIFVIEPLSGQIITRKEVKNVNLDVTSTPLITDNEIIFGTADKGLAALDKSTLETKWTKSINTSLVCTSPYTSYTSRTVETSPVMSDGIVYFGASDGFIYGIEASSGEEVWKVKTGAPVFSTVAISGNLLIVSDYSGNVYGFSSIPTLPPPPPVSILPPVATEATDISAKSFTANWETVENASGYYVSVYTSQEENMTFEEGFKNGLTANFDWIIEAKELGNLIYGKSYPAIKFSETGESIQTQEYLGQATALSFYLRAFNANGSVLTEAFNGEVWSQVDSLVLNNSNWNGTKSYPFDTDEEFIKFRISFYGENGYVIIDDVDVTLQKTIEYSIKNRWVTDNFSVVTGLQPETVYYYRIKASEKVDEENDMKEDISLFSNEIKLKTDEEGPTSLYNHQQNELYNLLNNPDYDIIHVYNVYGQKIKTIQNKEDPNEVFNLPSGEIYFLKAGDICVKFMK